LVKTGRRIINIACGFVLMLLVVGCKKDQRPATFSVEEHARIDSIVGTVPGDSLASLVSSFHKQGDIHGEVIAMEHLGRHYRDESKFDEAIKIHDDALKLAEQINDTLSIIRLLNANGTNYRRLGVLNVASKYHYRALELSMKYSDKTSYMARKTHTMAVNGLANVHLTLKNFDIADSALRVALQNEKEIGNIRGQAVNYANIGEVFEKRGQLDSALTYYQCSMAANREAKDTTGIAFCYSHFGEVLEQKQQYDAAEEQYKKAFDLLKSKRDRWHWLEPCIQLAQINIKKGNQQQGIDYLIQANRVANEIHSQEHLARINRLIYEIYDAKGNSKEALRYYIKAEEYDDSIRDLQKVNEIQNLRHSVYTQQQREEIETGKEKLAISQRARRITQVALIVIIGLAVAILGLMHHVLRLRMQHQRMQQKLNEGRELFFTNITHEFRTPLTVILGLASSIARGSNSDETELRNAGETIVKQGRTLLNLVNQLLDIAKLKSQTSEPEWHYGDIVGYLRATIDAYRELLVKKNLQLSFSASQETMKMDFVPDYINKVVSNLVSNAAKFTNHDGNIMISVEREGKFARMTFADDGKGMTERVKEHAFEPFFQDESDRNNVGTGVGLSLVKQLIDAMKGRIEVESELNKGTTFRIWLPIVQENVVSTPLDEHAKLSIDDTNFTDEMGKNCDSTDKNGTPTLLIIEDNADVANLIGMYLRSSYNLIFAENGEEGLRKANESVPDLIITDVMMPGISGYDVCKNVRNSMLLNHIPIIIITAKAADADHIEGIKAGADAYLTKPFNSDELKLRVGKLLEQRAMLRKKYSEAVGKEEEHAVEMPEYDRKFLDKIEETVNRLMPKGKTDVETIASEMCMSSAQFRRKLYSITGETPAAHIMNIRMKRAKQLLKEQGDLNISEISALCGFEDNAHFTRTFKNINGKTPSQFRKDAI